MKYQKALGDPATKSGKICPEQNQKIDISKDRFHTINDLLVYAPEIFLKNLENTLKNYKDLTLKFTK